MVGGFRETWVFVNKIRNVICMRKMCSVIWHLDGHSIFLFSPPRKSVSNVSATENMEQQEQKLMQEGDCRIVIQLTSLAGTFPLPRFLPRNRLNKEGSDMKDGRGEEYFSDPHATGNELFSKP